MSTVKHTFFCEDIQSGQLSAEESNHAVRVLRLKSSQQITVIDGKGKRIIAEITLADKKGVNFKCIEELDSITRKAYTHIAIAPTKNMDRFSFFVEKAIEIGVDCITPILCSNSERKALNIEKVRKSAIGALKQSGNLILPEIKELTGFRDFFTNLPSDPQRFIAHCEIDSEKKELKNQIGVEKNVVILIGPEGDFTLEEINLAKENQFLPVSLGASRLRTETAGIIACHTVSIV